jgi:hypothetical protein
MSAFCSALAFVAVFSTRSIIKETTCMGLKGLNVQSLPDARLAFQKGQGGIDR